MPNSKAEFYYRSYVDGDADGYTLSGDLLSTDNMLDRNVNTFSGTDGANDDTTTVTETFDMEWERSVDTFVLRSNLKDFDIQYWDGAAWQAFSPALTYTTNTKEFLLIQLASAVDTSKIKLTMTKTITADEEKKIYQFEITKKITEMYLEEISNLTREWKQVEFSNIYGKSILVVKYPNYGNMEITLNFTGLTDAEYTAYKTMKERRIIDSFNIYIYLSDTFEFLGEGAYYLVNDASGFKSPPSNTTIPGGVDGEMILKEC